MPIYEYQCDACSHKFEIIQKVSDGLLLRCPKCEQDRLRKLVSAAAFRLKGTGWYVTDFKDKKPAGKEGKTAVESGKQDSGTDGSATTTAITGEDAAATTKKAAAASDTAGSGSTGTKTGSE